MRKVLYFCDKCGKQIADEEFFAFSSRTGQIETCDQCAAVLRERIWKIVDDFMAEESAAVPAEKPKKKGKVIDLPKIGALRSAGWSVKNIAIEFGVAEQTIRNHLDEAMQVYREGLDNGMKKKEIEVDA